MSQGGALGVSLWLLFLPLSVIPGLIGNPVSFFSCKKQNKDTGSSIKDVKDDRRRRQEKARQGKARMTEGEARMTEGEETLYR